MAVITPDAITPSILDPVATLQEEVAKLISLEEWCKTSQFYSMRIEYERKEFILRWTEKRRIQPSTAQFPILEEGISAEKVVHREREEEIWKSSRLLAFGSYGHIRESEQPYQNFLIIKVARNSQQARQLIRNEIQLLAELSPTDLPIVKVSKEVVEDEDGIFGFFMEKLIQISPDEFLQLYDESKMLFIYFTRKTLSMGMFISATLCLMARTKYDSSILGILGSVGTSDF